MMVCGAPRRPEWTSESAAYSKATDDPDIDPDSDSDI
jgi:hypothetical protein